MNEVEMALITNDIERLRSALQSGVDPNERDELGTPAFFGMSGLGLGTHEDAIEMAEMVLESRADLTLVSHHMGCTVLEQAASQNHTLAEFLRRRLKLSRKAETASLRALEKLEEQLSGDEENASAHFEKGTHLAILDRTKDHVPPPVESSGGSK